MIQQLSHQPYYPRRRSSLDPMTAERNRLVCELATAVIESSEAGTPCGFSYLGSGKIEVWKGESVRLLIDLRDDCLALLRQTIMEVRA